MALLTAMQVNIMSVELTNCLLNYLLNQFLTCISTQCSLPILAHLSPVIYSPLLVSSSMVNLNWMAVKSPRNTLNLAAISNTGSSVILKVLFEMAHLRSSNSGRSEALSGISSIGVFPFDTSSYGLCLHTAKKKRSTDYTK